MGHGHPQVGGGLFGVHGVVEVSEEVGWVLGVGPGMESLCPQIVELVLRQIVLIGDNQCPVQMPQIVHGGGLAKPVRSHELPELLNDVAHQLFVPPLGVLSRKAEGKSVEVQDDKLLSQSEEPLDVLYGVLQRILFDKIMNQPELLRGLAVIPDSDVEVPGAGYQDNVDRRLVAYQESSQGLVSIFSYIMLSLSEYSPDAVE